MIIVNSIGIGIRRNRTAFQGRATKKSLAINVNKNVVAATVDVARDSATGIPGRASGFAAKFKIGFGQTVSRPVIHEQNDIKILLAASLHAEACLVGFDERGRTPCSRTLVSDHGHSAAALISKYKTSFGAIEQDNAPSVLQRTGSDAFAWH